MTQVYKNNVVSVIGTPLNTLMSTITVFVNTGNDFPALAENEFFLATLIGIDGEGKENRWEVVKVIERNGDDLIVQRGQDNTTAQQWATGTRIELRVTAAGMERGETAYMWGNHAEQGYLKGQSGDDLFLTKEEADALYLSPEWGDELFLTEAEADELFLTAAEGDELFLTQDEADDLYTEEAPTSGLVYGRANGDWVAIDPGEGGGSGGGGGAGTINLKYDDITPNGGDTYTLAIGGEPTESLGATNLLVSVNGTIQESGEAYTTSGTEITFSENLTSEDVIDFVVELTNGSYWTQEGLNLSYDGPGTKVIADQLQVKDAAQFDADVNVTGNVTAAKFIGDGSELDNLPAGSQWLNNGDDIYYNDGNVGVGASGASLDEKLVIQGNIKLRGANGVWFTNTSDVMGLQAVNSNILQLQANATAGELRFQTAGSTQMTVSKDGDVGINAIDPKALLDIRQDDDTADIARLRIWGKTNNPMLIVSGDEAENAIDFKATGSTAGASLTWTTSGSQSMALDGSGRLGIGMEPTRSTFDLTADEQLEEWKTKAKKASWEIVTDGEFSQEPTEELVEQWIEARGAEDKLQVNGDGFFAGAVKSDAIYSRFGSAHGISFADNSGSVSVAPVRSGTDDGTVDLGQSDRRWKDGYFSGAVSVGNLKISDSSIYRTGQAGLFFGTTSGALRVMLPTNSSGVVDNSVSLSLGSGTNQFASAHFAGTVNATEFMRGGVPVTTKLDLINTLSTLRKATMDETQDIRESLRSAIDELISGFEQEIATMPAPEPEVSTMPAGDES
jgi:hypothetical protein